MADNVDDDEHQHQEEHFEITVSDKEEAEKLGMHHSIPTLDHYNRTYARTMSDDKKALSVFRDFESHEKLRRLQAELMLVRDNKVMVKALDRVVGKKKKSKYESYSRWAQLMLLWMTSKK